MNRYQQLYNNGATQDELNSIKNMLNSNQVLSWEEYYWGTKCIVEYDSEESDPDLIIKSLNKAFRNGLTRRSHPEIYQDALKTISVFYSVFGKYEQVINHLMLYVESLEDAAPDWAYHDLINAQIHTDQIEIMLENPNSFLPDLARNDNLSLSVEMKQKNLFRDFLIASTDYLRQYNDVRVSVLELAEAAAEYDLLGSEAWVKFAETVHYHDVTPDKMDVQHEKKPPVLIAEKSPEIPQQLPQSNGNETSNEKERLANEFKERIEFQQKTINELQAELTNRDQTNDLLKKQLKKAEDEKSTAMSNLAESEKKLSSLQSELQIINEQHTTLLGQISAGQKGNEALKEEIDTLKNSLDNMRKSKEAVESENSVLKRKCASLQRQVSANEVTMIDMQDCARQAALRAAQLEAQLAEAHKQLNEIADKTEEEPQLTEKDIFGRCYYYLNYPCLEAGKEWLKNRLPQISSKDFMTKCFFPHLTPSQTVTANENGWTTIYDFDLAPILRVIKFNLRSIPTFIPSKKDENVVSDMIGIRNLYAHSNGWNIKTEEAIKDITTMSSFMRLMGGDAESINEMNEFIEKISA